MRSLEVKIWQGQFEVESDLRLFWLFFHNLSAVHNLNIWDFFIWFRFYGFKIFARILVVQKVGLK